MTTASSISTQSNKKPNSISIARSMGADGTLYPFTSKDVILYNLGVGARASQLQWTYENDELFQAIPSFGVLPALSAMFLGDTQWMTLLPTFPITSLLHAEQSLTILASKLPIAATLKSSCELVQLLSKGSKGVSVTLRTESKDTQNETPVFVNESTFFIRGVKIDPSLERKSKDLQGQSISSDFLQQLMKTRPHAMTSGVVGESAGALYRLSGDVNPIHIDPAASSIAGFSKPIMHGLCTFGMMARHFLESFTFSGERASSVRITKINGRFAKEVYPGETLESCFWFAEGGDPRQNNTCKTGWMAVLVNVRERNNETVLSNATIHWAKEVDGIGRTDMRPTITQTTTSMPTTQVMGGSRKTEDSPLVILIRQMADALEALPTEKRAAIVKKFKANVQFNITDLSGEIPAVFHINLKDGLGSVVAGSPKSHPDLSITLSLNNFMKLAAGEQSGQAAFMKGLLKLKGKIALALGLDSLMQTLRTSGPLLAKL